MTFRLRTAFAVCHRFGIIVFAFSFDSRYSLISSWISLWTHSVACYLAPMHLCVFQFPSCSWFLVPCQRRCLLRCRSSYIFWDVFDGLPCDLSWKMFPVPMFVCFGVKCSKNTKQRPFSPGFLGWYSVWVIYLLMSTACHSPPTVTVSVSLYVSQYLLSAISCSYVDHVKVYKSYALLLEWSFYHCDTSFFDSCYSFCFQVYFVWCKYGFGSFFYPRVHLHEVSFSIPLLLVPVCLSIWNDSCRQHTYGSWFSFSIRFATLLFFFSFSFLFSCERNL